MNPDRTLPWDWHPGHVPENVHLGESAYIESTISFEHYRSQARPGLSLGKGSAIYKDSMLDLGRRSSVQVGDYSLIHGVRISCDGPLTIGNHVLMSWQVVIMDSYRMPMEAHARQQHLRDHLAHPITPQTEQQEPGTASMVADVSHDSPIDPICIQDNVWIGFEVCILPGVTIGEGSVVGARSVVVDDVPAYTIVAGNPARVVRQIKGDSKQQFKHQLNINLKKQEAQFR